MTRTFGPRRSPRRRLTLLAIAGALIAAGLLATSGHASFLTDSGSPDVQVPDKTTSKGGQTTGGAFVTYLGDSDANLGSSGTGTFTPFVRLQGSPTEQGYNTDGTTQFDTKVGTWTHSIKVSQIPIRPCAVGPGDGTATGQCFELFVDINESNTAKYVSLNTVDVWFTQNASLTGYPFTPSATTTEQYKYNDAGGVLIHDVNQGSGRGDLRYDIPISDFTIPAGCNYGNPACNTYFVLYSKWGSSNAAPDGNTYASEGGFEEWKVKVYAIPPDISVAKTPDGGSINAGGNAVFTIVTTNNGPTTATGVTLTDTLPTSPGSGLSWTVGGTDAASCSITAGVLNCNFGDVPFPGSKTVTLTSSTTAANCGTINNTGTVSSTNEGPNTANNTDSGSITVNCAAIAILKESSKSGNPLVSVAGAVFHVTGPNSYAADVTDNGSGDEDSANIGAVCISGLAPGTYTVSETTPPTGYGSGTAVDNTSTATSGTNCTTSKPTTADSAVFTDPPLTDIAASATSEVTGGTQSTVTCQDSSSTDVGNSPQGPSGSPSVTATGLAPGTYICTIVVDP